MSIESVEISTAKMSPQEGATNHDQQSPFIICASGGKIIAQVCGEVFVVDKHDSGSDKEPSIIFKPIDINYPTTLLDNSITIDDSTLTYLNLQQPQLLQNDLSLLNGIDEEHSQISDTPLDIGINEQPTFFEDSASTEANNLHSALVIKQNGSIVYTSQKENTANYSLEYHLDDFIVGNDTTLADMLTSQKGHMISKDQWLDLMAAVNESQNKGVMTDTSVNHLFDELINAITNDSAHHI